MITWASIGLSLLSDLLREPHPLRALGVDLHAFFHEAVHLIDTDVDQFKPLFAASSFISGSLFSAAHKSDMRLRCSGVDDLGMPMPR